MQFDWWFLCCRSTIISRDYSLSKKRHLVWRKLLLLLLHLSFLLVTLSLHIVWVSIRSSITTNRSTISIYILTSKLLSWLSTLSIVILIVILAVRFWISWIHIVTISLDNWISRRSVIYVVPKNIGLRLVLRNYLAKFLLETWVVQTLRHSLVLSNYRLFIWEVLISSIAT